MCLGMTTSPGLIFEILRHVALLTWFSRATHILQEDLAEHIFLRLVPFRSPTSVLVGPMNSKMSACSSVRLQVVCVAHKVLLQVEGEERKIQ